MADQGQQIAPPRGGGAAGRGRGRGGGNPGSGASATMFLNPERAPPLISKWQKLLGKELGEIRVSYTPDGVTVELFGMKGSPFEHLDDDGDSIGMSVPEFRVMKEKEATPSNEDAKFAFRNKFEVRLNQEFPQGVDLGDGSETALRTAVQALPFNQRRVMLMSNKQFKTAYPNGVAGAAGAAA